MAPLPRSVRLTAAAVIFGIGLIIGHDIGRYLGADVGAGIGALALLLAVTVFLWEDPLLRE